MTGLGLMLFLICVYAVTAATFAWEGNYPKAMYWVGAFIITASVLWMGEK